MLSSASVDWTFTSSPSPSLDTLAGLACCNARRELFLSLLSFFFFLSFCLSFIIPASCWLAAASIVTFQVSVERVRKCTTEPSSPCRSSLPTSQHCLVSRPRTRNQLIREHKVHLHHRICICFTQPSQNSLRSRFKHHYRCNPSLIQKPWQKYPMQRPRKADDPLPRRVPTRPPTGVVVPVCSPTSIPSAPPSNARLTRALRQHRLVAPRSGSPCARNPNHQRRRLHHWPGWKRKYDAQ